MHHGRGPGWPMDWFVARNGKPDGPLTFQGVVDAARKGELGDDDYVWQPGAERWERAGDVPALWVPPPKPLAFLKLSWRRAAGVVLVISGATLLVMLPSLMRVEADHPRSIKRDCALGDYLKGRCR